MKRIIPLLALAALFLVSCDKGPDPTKGYLEIKNDTGQKIHLYVTLETEKVEDRYEYKVKNVQPGDVIVRKVPIGKYWVITDLIVVDNPMYDTYIDFWTEVEPYKTTHLSIIKPEGF